MKINRRKVLATGFVGGVAVAAHPSSSIAQSDADNPNYVKLDEILDQPTFKKELFSDPIIIESVDLLRYKNSFLCRVRSKEGAVGISVAHDTMSVLYPIFVNRLQQFFINQDARRLDELVEKALVFSFNYRFGGLGIGIPLATIEFAILDMMGRISEKSVGQLIGKIHNTHIPVYQATEWREKPVKESVALIQEAVQKSKAKAVKIKVGALMFMTKDLDARGPAGRTEEIIPLIRETFGDDMALYADANGYYEDVNEAIRVGKLLEDYKYRYFEEPVFFDWLDGAKQVADALSIPVAGGEQQHSIYAFRWLLANDGLDIVQPDHYYFGGMIRSLKVARMGEAMGKECIPHLSGGFGFIYMLHLVSVMPNAGPHIEFKGYTDLPIECKTSSLRLEDGKIKVPTGSGIGVDIDPDYIKKYSVVKDV
ncbi:MAG: mandelate racemase/muconate lactonizing enzyme family protein [Candidatus Omnitrophica bacterium]|nr:mandelate racemase/muconate lactonizing enzyme family protein [Candidatus Omnitrophota bacterium]